MAAAAGMARHGTGNVSSKTAATAAVQGILDHGLMSSDNVDDVKGSGKPRGSTKVMTKLQEIEKEMIVKDFVKPVWIKTPKADGFFGIVIFLNAAYIGVDLEFAPDGFSWGFWGVESVFLLTFLIELIMRIVAERPTPWRFFATGNGPEWWGIFDFAVTMLGCSDAWVVTPLMTMSSGDAESPMSSFTVLRVFRLIRLARLIRVLRMFNELVVLVQTLGQSIKAVGWMSLLLGIIIYTGSVITVILIGEPMRKENEEIDAFFGTLGDALFSHFCVVTLEGWPDIARAAMVQSPLWAFYFVAMITLTNFALVNLMVGVIVERIIHFSLEQDQELSAFVAESAQFRKTLEVLFNEADMDRNGEVTKEEIRSLMKDPRTHEIMAAFGINLDIPQTTLFTIMDLNSDGPTTFAEFFNACMRLCGSKQSIHSIFVQHDICETRRDLCQRINDLQSHVMVQGAGSRISRPASPAPTGIVSADVQQASGEDCVTELLERMDRFGQVQLQICSEIQALKEQAALRTNSNSYTDADANYHTLLSKGPKLRDKSPREMGPCCVDSLFSRRKEQITPRRPRDDNLGKQTRKELEAEFRANKK